jgi:hypothetical protein
MPSTKSKMPKRVALDVLINSRSKKKTQSLSRLIKLSTKRSKTQERTTTSSLMTMVLDMLITVAKFGSMRITIKKMALERRRDKFNRKETEPWSNTSNHRVLLPTKRSK